MKLKTKLFLITNSKGQEINVKRKDVALDLNGERMKTKLLDIISKTEFDDGEIYGNSLLSYYQVNEDGSLQVEGSKIQLVDASTNEPILVKQIIRPGIYNDIDMPFDHVQKFVEFFKITKPDEVFDNLSDDEKQVFISERTAKEKSQSIETEASTADKAAAESERLQKEKQNKELKESIDPAYVHENSGITSTRTFYSGIEGFKEFIKDQYHLFYGDNPAYEPCVLIKRGTWWEECREELTEVIQKDDTTVVIEFMDGTEKKKVTLDINAGTINITNS